MAKRDVLFFACFAGLSLWAAPPGREPAPALKPAMVFETAPLYFIPNAGQTGKEALFYARALRTTLWLTREGLIFDRIEKDKNGCSGRSLTGLVFLDANRDIEIAPLDPTGHRASYFHGRDESEWTTDIPTFRTVVYKNVYNGIDLKVYGSAGLIEYDWIVAPGAGPEQIRFALTGEAGARPDGAGGLAMNSPTGTLLHRKPHAYQMIAGRRTEIDASFQEVGDGVFGFTVGAFDPSRDLVIDPLVLAYSTYLGGSSYDVAAKVVVDPSGAIYIAGCTGSKDFPPVRQSLPRNDLFVTKLAPDGKTLIYSAFFPSYGGDENCGIAVDAKGFVYVAGATESSKFPVKNAFQDKSGGWADGFVLKLARDGKSLVYSSYIGGDYMDHCAAVAADTEGAAYIVGSTSSRSFPVKNAFRKYFGNGHWDAFAAKVAPSGSLVYCTCLGEAGNDQGMGLAVDVDGQAVIAGQTYSPAFPVKSAFQNVYGGNGDAFVTKLSRRGTGLVFSSFFGGGGRENLTQISMDRSGAVYLVGFTYGNIPLKKAFQKKRKGAADAFIAKFRADGNGIEYSSYLGGSGWDGAFSVAADAAGTAFVVGYTASADFPVLSPFQKSLHGSRDAFLAAVNPNGASLVFSTYLGGRYRDEALGVAVGPGGDVFACGVTNSGDFPRAAPFQKTLLGEADAFVVRFTPENE